jgi:hypothetical protein
MSKNQEKKDAIILRRQGLSYNEILRKVDVSKSTLSLWLRKIGLAKQQKQRLTEKRKAAQQKAQEACRRNRISKENEIVAKAKKEIGKISRRELWLIGIVAYWAEGAKQKTGNVSQRVSFSNSDPEMILLFDKWIKEICGISLEDVSYSIYIHKTANYEKARIFWENVLNTKINLLYFKHHNPKTNRKNIGDNYNGMLRVDIKRSTDLNREINGWILGISESFHNKKHCPVAKR